MPTQCNAEQLQFSCVARRRVVAAFDGGTVSSDAGALLLGRTDEAIGLIDRLAGCFIDQRDPGLIEHTVRTLLGQRVFGMALGYEDLNDHERLRHDPVFGALLGKLEPQRRADCAALAGKSTLNRLELHESEGSSRYHKIRPDGPAIERLWVELFLEAHRVPPHEIILDLDATDDPLHGHQEGRFFHGYYDGYCYLPLYIFCGEHLLVAKLRRANSDGAAGAQEEVARVIAQIRARWPDTRIILRADSGCCREALMRWCEQNAVDYVSDSPGTPAWCARSAPSCKPPRPSRVRPSARHGASGNSCTARARAGAGRDGWWPRPSRPGMGLSEILCVSRLVINRSV